VKKRKRQKSEKVEWFGAGEVRITARGVQHEEPDLDRLANVLLAQANRKHNEEDHA